MPSFFDLMAESSRHSSRSSITTEISIEEQEVVDSISNELIVSGLPMDVAGDVLAFAGGFGFRPRGGRGGRHGGRRHGGGRGHHHEHWGDHGEKRWDDHWEEDGDQHGNSSPEQIEENAGPDAALPLDPAPVPAPEPALEPAPIDDALLDAVEVGDPLDAEIPEPAELDQPEQDLAELIEDYEGEEFEVDPDDLEEVLDEIDDPAVDELVNGGNTLTLAQIQQLFELYFNTINNTTITENTTNNTFVDNSINQNVVVNDNSVNTVNIDNSVSNVIDNTDNSVNDIQNISIQDSFNSVIDNSVIDNSVVDNSVNHFQLSSTSVSLDGMISGDRDRGREAVRGTRDDDLIEAGPGRDRLIGRRGADSFVFSDAGGCGRRQADQIRDFRPRQGDRILLDADEFGGDGNVGVAENRRDFRAMKREGDVDFLYYQPKGNLYYDENGNEGGFGDGGLLAALKGSPSLSADQISLI